MPKREMISNLTELPTTITAGICGLFSAILGFFMPIKDIIHLIVVFFILDVLVGYWAARKLRGEKFSTPRVWETTIPRMILSILVVTMSFAWDKVFAQDFVSTYKTVGWFIAGIILYSIVKNAYKITHWYVFPGLAELIKEKLKIKEEENETEP